MPLAQQIRRFAGQFTQWNSDKDMNALADGISSIVSALQGIPFLDGIQLSAQTLTGAADNTLTHGLGRPWRGFLILDVSAAATIYSVPAVAGSYDEATFIKLHPSAGCTVDVWVF